jgi:carbon storage regulator
MLVVSRKRGEAVRIGHDILIRVLESSGGRVRLGIDAPKQVRIVRQELRLSPAGAGAPEPGQGDIRCNLSSVARVWISANE